jgi:hypothetical protein
VETIVNGDGTIVVAVCCADEAAGWGVRDATAVEGLDICEEMELVVFWVEFWVEFW